MMLAAVRIRLFSWTVDMAVLTMNGADVFESNTIVLASGAAAKTAGRVYLGRPWGGNVQRSLQTGPLADSSFPPRKLMPSKVTSFIFKLFHSLYIGRVIFKNTVTKVALEGALWSIWQPGDERTNNVYLADYDTSGVSASRATFATVLTASQAAAYDISSAVGSDYLSWVDAAYI